MLPQAHPLAGISGAINAVSFNTELLGAVTVSGPGAGRPLRMRQDKGERAMAQQQEMKAAEETYSGFLSLFKVGSIITAIVTVFVVLLIAS